MKRWLLVLAGIASLAISAGIVACSRNPAPKVLPLTVSFTCDVRGRLVPCGCFTGQYGGLTRVAAVFKGERMEQSLRLDVGDALAGPEDYQQIQHRYILEAFANMGYEAANIGHREAALNVGELRKLKASVKVPLLSANLLDAATGQPVFDGYKIVQRGGWRVAVVGVLDEQIQPEALGNGLRIEKMETVLGRLLPSLRDKSDFIVLMAFADEQAISRLAQQFYECDVILGGKVSQPSQKLVKQNRSLVLATTNQSRALGVLRVRLEKPHRMEAVSGEVQLMRDDIPQEASVRALAAAYRGEIRDTRLAIDNPESVQSDFVPGVKRAAVYVGSQACAQCHGAAAKVWEASGHAHAFEALVASKADADPNCIGCHAVGFGTASGYRRNGGNKDFANVGCESCHGPGSRHVEERRSGVAEPVKMRPLGSGDCQKCHHGEFSRPFEYDKFWKLIQH